MASWARQYSKRKSTAESVLERMGKREVKSKVDDAPTVSSIPPDKYFILRSGKQLKSVKELALNFDSISEEDYRHHVNSEKNDFANWIRDVFQEKSLAESLAEVNDRKESQIVLLKHVAKS